MNVARLVLVVVDLLLLVALLNVKCMVFTLRVIYKDYKEGSGEMPVQGQVG